MYGSSCQLVIRLVPGSGMIMMFYLWDGLGYGGLCFGCEFERARYYRLGVYIFGMLTILCYAVLDSHMSVCPSAFKYVGLG